MRTSRTGGGITNRSRRTGGGITNRAGIDTVATARKTRPSTVPVAVSPVRRAAQRSNNTRAKLLASARSIVAEPKSRSPKLPAIVLSSPVRRARHAPRYKQSQRDIVAARDAAMTGAATLHEMRKLELKPSLFEPDTRHMKTARDGLLVRFHSKLTEQSLDDTNQNLFSTFKWLARDNQKQSSASEAGICFGDFNRALKHMGIKSTAALSKSTFSFLDGDKNGQIGFDEFAKKVSTISSQNLSEMPTNSKFAKSHVVHTLGQLKEKKRLMHMPSDMGYIDFDGDGAVDAEEMVAYNKFKEQQGTKPITKTCLQRFWGKFVVDNAGENFNQVTKGFGQRKKRIHHHRRAERDQRAESQPQTQAAPELNKDGAKSPQSVVETLSQMPENDFRKSIGLLRSRIRSTTLRSSKGVRSAIFNTEDKSAHREWVAELNGYVSARAHQNPVILSRTQSIARQRAARKASSFEDFQAKHYGYSRITKHMYK